MKDPLYLNYLDYAQKMDEALAKNKEWYKNDIEVTGKVRLNPALQRTPSAFGFGGGEKPGSPLGLEMVLGP